MLSKKTLYAIYILHCACGLYGEEMPPAIASGCETETADVLNTLLNKGYVDTSGRVLCNLNDKSLLDLLGDLGEFPVTDFPSDFPRTLSDINRILRLWLQSIKLNQI